MTLSGHKRKIETFQFNPVAENVLASGSMDKTLKIWDVQVGKEQLSLDTIHGDAVSCVAWNRNGTLLATTSKDKKIRIIDPRSGSVVQVAFITFLTIGWRWASRS